MTLPIAAKRFDRPRLPSCFSLFLPCIAAVNCILELLHAVKRGIVIFATSIKSMPVVMLLLQSFSAVWDASPADRRTLGRLIATWDAIFPSELLQKLKLRCGLAGTVPVPVQPDVFVPSGLRSYRHIRRFHAPSQQTTQSSLAVVIFACAVLSEFMAGTEKS